jgi:glutaminase
VGVCVRAPPLDRHGNSVRGIEFCKRLGKRMHWALLDVIQNKQTHHTNN